MNVETKYTDIKNLIGDNIKELVLTPNFYSNKVRGAKKYLNRLHMTPIMQCLIVKMIY